MRRRLLILAVFLPAGAVVNVAVAVVGAALGPSRIYHEEVPVGPASRTNATALHDGPVWMNIPHRERVVIGELVQDCYADLDGDGQVGINDFLLVLALLDAEDSCLFTPRSATGGLAAESIGQAAKVPASEGSGLPHSVQILDRPLG